MRHGSILILFIVGLFLMSCGSDELSRLRAENAALRKALEEYQPEIEAMRNMNAWLDSIDVNRHSTHSDEGNSEPVPQAVSSRLQDVNRYVITSEEKLTRFEDSLHQSKQALYRFELMISELEHEVNVRDERIEDLKSSLSVYEQAHRSLTHNIIIRQDSLTAMHEDLALLQAKMDGLIAHLRIKEGDAIYAKGKAAEELVKRSRAPIAQKRDGYREALEVFKKAFSLGNQEAADSIAELEWRLLTDPELLLGKPTSFNQIRSEFQHAPG